MARVELTGRPICITGASSGIGRAAALACARAGMPVVVSARREDRLLGLVNEIRSLGGKAEAVVADISSEGSGERIVKECVSVFGSVYAVFANAGYGLASTHHEASAAEVRAIFETNVFGTLRLIDAALPGMIAAGEGHVLVCSSCLSAMPMPGHGAYSATKAAQFHLASAMRVELGPLGVRVSTVHPVGTRTEFSQSAVRRRGGVPRTPGAFSQSSERVATAVVRGLRRPKPEIWTSELARVGFHFAALAPGTRDWVLNYRAWHREQADAKRST